MASFSKLPAVKKDTIFGAPTKIFGPSYFMTAFNGILNKVGERMSCKQKIVNSKTKSTYFNKT